MEVERLEKSNLLLAASREDVERLRLGRDGVGVDAGAQDGYAVTVGVQLSRLGLADEVGDHGSRLVLGEDAADADVALALVGEQLLEGHVAVTLGREDVRGSA